ncbi:MAG: ribonuclease J [Rhodospirillaceae bacterium]|nr:ribonuclease J [Rhodospirillaceae bacterium]
MSRPLAAADDALTFTALGGSEEIGMNLYVYEVDGRLLVVDCGITFGDDTTPGIDVLMPDPSYLEARREDIVGLVLTHAHEDHFGAIGYLWPRLRCPIYATPFSAALLRLKLADQSVRGAVQILEVPLGGTLDLGPFQVTYVTMTHSIPEPNALVLRTRHGIVVHSGDWKLDPTPTLGEVSDTETLRRLGEEGVRALICDSTNALEPGRSGSETMVREALTRVVAAQANRVVVTCFSTNVARLESIAHAAHANGRHCALVGRSLWRVHTAALEAGYLKDLAEPFLSDAEAAVLPRDRVVLACTGSQGEGRSALSRIAQGGHPNIDLDPGDTVVYSAREIPGNEKAIIRVQNALVAAGIRILTPHDDPQIHVSGHPNRDELVDLYGWLRPAVAIPTHGEAMHTRAHAELARACQVPEVVIPRDGAVIRLAPGPAEVIDHVPVGRLALDGDRLIPLERGAVGMRRKLMHNGAVVVSLALDGGGRLLGEPQVSAPGLEDDLDGDEALIDIIAEDVVDALDGLSKRQRQDDDVVREAVRVAARRSVREARGKRPPTDVHLMRL